MQALSLLAVLADFSTELSSTTVGPFGLAFTSVTAAKQTLSCDGLRGRPFVTGLQVQQLSAPLGGRDAYEFRVQCGPALSEWSELGPPLLLWASSSHGSASCPRPQSVRGLVVSRGRSEASRADLFSFSLVCPDPFGQGGVELVELAGLTEAGSTAEQRGRQCPEGSFVSAIEVSRGHEPQGAYDLYEFELTCSEIVEPPPPPPPEEGYTTRGFTAAARGDTRGSGGGGGGGGGEEDEPQMPTQRGPRGGRGVQRGAPAIERKGAAAEASSEGTGDSDGGDVRAQRRFGSASPEKGGSMAGGGGAGGGGAGGAAGNADQMELLRELLDRRRRQQQQTADAVPVPTSTTAEDAKQARMRAALAQLEEAGADTMFGRVRESAVAPAEAEEAEAEEAEAEAAPEVVPEAASKMGEAEREAVERVRAAAEAARDEARQGDAMSQSGGADSNAEGGADGGEVADDASETLTAAQGETGGAGTTEAAEAAVAADDASTQVESRLDSVLDRIASLKMAKEAEASDSEDNGAAATVGDATASDATNSVGELPTEEAEAQAEAQVEAQAEGEALPENGAAAVAEAAAETVAPSNAQEEETVSADADGSAPSAGGSAEEEAELSIEDEDEDKQ